MIAVSEGSELGRTGEMEHVIFVFLGLGYLTQNHMFSFYSSMHLPANSMMSFFKRPLSKC